MRTSCRACGSASAKRTATPRAASWRVRSSSAQAPAVSMRRGGAGHDGDLAGVRQRQLRDLGTN